ncbi:MAG: delta-60 repeat domain-containing protein [Saprospiraceae bacterium]
MKLKICIVNIFFLVVPLWLIGQPGDLDNGFGTMGFVNLDPAGSFNNNFYAMAIQSDGKIIIAGQAAPNAILMRLKNDGQLDETFGNNAISLSHFEQNDTDGSFFTDIALSPNGKIIALCYSGKDFSNFVSMGLARFNGDKTLITAFGQGGYVNTNLGALTERGINLSIQSDGKKS